MIEDDLICCSDKNYKLCCYTSQGMIDKLGQIMLYPHSINCQNCIKFKTATEISTLPLILFKHLPNMNKISKNPVNKFPTMIVRKLGTRNSVCQLMHGEKKQKIFFLIIYLYTFKIYLVYVLILRPVYQCIRITW